MSISALAKNDWKLIFEKGRVVVLKEGQSMTVREAEEVYAVVATSLTSTDLSTISTPSTLFTSSTHLTLSGPAGRWLQKRLLYRRMGHLNQEYVRQLVKAAKQDFRIRFEKKEFHKTCVLAKQRRKPNKEPAERAKRPGQRIHADLCKEGYTFALKELQKSAEFELLPASEGGAKYFIIITNDFSRYRKTVPLKHKVEAEKAIQEFVE